MLATNGGIGQDQKVEGGGSDRPTLDIRGEERVHGCRGDASAGVAGDRSVGAAGRATGAARARDRARRARGARDGYGRREGEVRGSKMCENLYMIVELVHLPRSS